jgi:pyrrolysine biosynthesis protein PylD
MTRLVPEDLRGIPAGLPGYDAALQARTGCPLRALACRASGVGETRFARLARRALVAVVPLDAGQGVLPGFAEAVRAIAAHLGFPAWVTEAPDAGGLAEAYREGAGILVAADESSYIAVNLRSHRVSDNNETTARGFVTALDLMAGGLSGKGVLVLGAGAVGRAAARYLLARGARVSLFDVRGERARQAAAELSAAALPAAAKLRSVLPAATEVRVEADLERALQRHRLLFDATPEPGFIHERHLAPDSRVAAPGVPLGLSTGAARAAGNRLVHDPLQIGTAVMLAEALLGERPAR